MSKLVTIYGGSGFVGRYVARRMAKQGWRVRVAVRRPNEALFVKPYGAVGQVEPMLCNIRDDNSVREVMQGADAVVNCVGILLPRGKNTFHQVHDIAAGRIAQIAAEEGVERLVHVSSLASDPDAPSQYGRTKARGDAAVQEAFPSAVILRPSIIFGQEDAFFNRFANMTRMSPVIPVVGADTKFQPVHVDDVAAAAEKAILGQAEAGIYELGGPDVESFRDLLKRMLRHVQRRRGIVNIPFGIARINAFAFDMVQKLSFDLVPSLLSRDQVRNLRVDHVVSDDAKGFADLGIQPKAMDAMLPDYLWRFRENGQYAAITASAKNLKA
ncbi:complex I NDUFA9 subunit family protein [Aliiroseovarius crassostreae]|uniref:complex I NDUFA9 subunit family protein n=1 Tax=Aliiroseovarius crassostreae TaxID=154981 RepID=UPI00220F5E46|nr:complex I NDUFA9 subunit family protein [Aliiroseovarius crassostreae]UWP89098.1 complex I NDUFA9 subunit family protein [Aliiroseovarius crassostreae]UWP98563.1 complex I NDUFA9 subunit family protein [Aliiroseovarius crassostreae]UWQ07989.1 complex I NDUFA9 subunit family protein [Aliiroseovarius crassostreae]UWQ11094.1 complex I NDUFA9 subunit family protein [Aliiroseovarius crassostreae]